MNNSISSQDVSDDSGIVRRPLSRSQHHGMQHGRVTKYRPFAPINLPDRQWPSRQITQAPMWCSVDLRDGNQALAIPMSVEEKLRMFDLLVEIGFKEIEVGFPAASQIEYEFMRRLIDEKRIPDDVTIQVLVQAREELIHRTFEAVQGAKNVIIHLYNSTNPTQRRVVFNMSRDEIKAIAVNGTKIVKSLVPTLGDTNMTYQYSPESFSATELEFALEVCEAVMAVWQPTAEHKMILNLPATVEMSTPNQHADQIEWFGRHVKNRDCVMISLHPHNDRGTAVAATELGLMAGAERVEGTLFGNGERTGNVDIVTLALNMYTQGIDPQLDFSNINRVRDIYTETTRMAVHERHPYVGELVFTAFSGSHQDAIHKGMMAQPEEETAAWDVPYLPMDPADVGRSYEAIIRINAQSGKGGVSYLLKRDYGIDMPRPMTIEFGKIINEVADERGDELSILAIKQLFDQTYMQPEGAMKLERFQSRMDNGEVTCKAQISINGRGHTVSGCGNGPIDAFVDALAETAVPSFEITHYSQHALTHGADAKAIAYIQIETAAGQSAWGAAVDTNTEMVSIKGILNALQRVMTARPEPMMG
ncbi:MAG: 2-isopropylmalate synthase [Anaerolineales bacterium]|nr:2-isopropylmalate synthase [Anaerolineales bacterium]